MRGWKQGYVFLAGQESRDCFDFISDVGIRGIWLLVLPNSNNLINHVLWTFRAAHFALAL